MGDNNEEEVANASSNDNINDNDAHPPKPPGTPPNSGSNTTTMEEHGPKKNVNEVSQGSFLSRIFGSPSKKKTSVPIQDVSPAAEQQKATANEKEDKPQNPFEKIVERYKVEGDLFDEETVQAMIAVLEAKKKSKSSTELK